MAISEYEIDLSRYIEHSMLHPAATVEQVKHYCQQADQWRFPCVCVYPNMVRIAEEELHNSRTQVCTVIGFPSGAHTRATKLYEAQEAVDNGATELDVVLSLGLLKMGRSDDVYQEIAEIRELTGVIVKAVLETSLLTDDEKCLAAEICLDAGADYLKTSTGWFGGATTDDVKLLSGITKGRIGIKAAGGIKTPEQALNLIRAGATRLGTSRGVKIMEERDAMAD
ncbi:deoxyribose-phosphate aldolase [[Limnothrix rosea] IAM M-220]|uniref:deoxyribose-phosphate aldolase n=1 Tax=[Limnothrix rosea] IAM M-220 TaxID=454133 RepID=UPI00096A1550|nr:deoxyribose-phosphate aldolase [[Limnothrix rosea] IAM M-220]OKH17994.1 deoxyribose-phosphate aldolase [[Limnothrix rosea] IAM M-220]